MELSSLHERIQSVVGGQTYRSIAEATNQHPETVRRYMQGQAPSAEFLSALCFKFDINAQWLLTGQGSIRHTESRAHALREANPTELLAAIAAALERLTDRVDRIELFVQTLESRLRGRGLTDASDPVEAQLLETKANSDADEEAARPDARAGRIADVIAKRSRANAG